MVLQNIYTIKVRTKTKCKTVDFTRKSKKNLKITFFVVCFWLTTTTWRKHFLNIKVLWFIRQNDKTVPHFELHERTILSLQKIESLEKKILTALQITCIYACDIDVVVSNDVLMFRKSYICNYKSYIFESRKTDDFRSSVLTLRFLKKKDNY